MCNPSTDLYRLRTSKNTECLHAGVRCKKQDIRTYGIRLADSTEYLENYG